MYGGSSGNASGRTDGSSGSSRRPNIAVDLPRPDRRPSRPAPSASSSSQSSRPISNLLSQLEDFALDFNPAAAPQQQRPQQNTKSQDSEPLFRARNGVGSRNGAHTKSPDDFGSSFGDVDNDMGAEADKILADLEKLLPGRGKSTRGTRKDVPARSDTSASTARDAKLTPPSRTTSSAASPRLASENSQRSQEPLQRFYNGPQSSSTTSLNSIKRELAAPPRLAISPKAPSSTNTRPTPSSPLTNTSYVPDVSRYSPARRSLSADDIPSPLGTDVPLYALLLRPIKDLMEDPGSKAASTKDDLFMPGGKRLSSFTVMSGQSMMDVADGMIIQIMEQEADKLAAEFPVLTSEKYDAKKKALKDTMARIKALQKRLALETKIKEAANSLNKLDSGGDRGKTQQAKEQLAHAEKKVEAIAAALWEAVQQLIEIERSILKHVAGVLRWSATNAKEQQASKPSPPRNAQSRDASRDVQERLNSAEIRIKEQHRENDILRKTVSQLESEQEPLRSLAAQAKKEARVTREIRDRYRTDQTTKSEAEDLLKLQLAVARADIEHLTEEVHEARNNHSKLQLQLDDNVTLMEEKDRTIADLLAQVEELTTQADMSSRAADQARSVHKPTRNSAWYREQVTEQVASHSAKMRAVLGDQLKEAVLERERMRLQYNEQTEIASELRSQLAELRQNGNKGRDSPRARGAFRGGDSGSDTEPEALTPRSPGSGSLRSPSRLQASDNSRRRDPKLLAAQLDQQEQVISDLRRQLAKSNESSAGSEDDQKRLMRLYDDIVAAKESKDSYSRSYSVDVLTKEVQSLIRERRRASEEIQNLQRQVESSVAVGLEQEKANSNMAKLSQDAARVGEMRRELQRVEQERDTAMDAQRDLERQIASLKDTRDSPRDRDLNNDKVADLEKQIAAKDDDIDRLEDELDSVKNNVARLQRENKDLSAQVDELDQDIQAQEKEFEDRLAREKDEMSANHRNELGSLNEALTKARADADQWNRRCDELQRQLEAEKEWYKQEMVDLQANHAKVMQDSESRFQREMDELNDELTSLTKELASGGGPAAIAALTETLENAKREHSKAIQEQQQAHDREVDALASRHDELKARFESSEQALMSSKQQYFQERERLQERIDNAAIERDLAIQEKTQNEQIMKQAQAELNDVRERFEKVSKDFQEAQRRAASAEDEANGMIMELEKMKMGLESRDAEISKLSSTLAEKEHQLNEALSITSEIGMIQQMLEEKEHTIVQAQREAENAKRELVEYRAAMEDKEKDFKEGQQLLDTMQQMVMSLKRGRADLVEEMEDAKYREEMMKRKADGLERTVEQLTRTTIELTAQSRNLESTVSTQKAEMDTLREKIQDLSVDRLGSGDNGSTAAMRADFRKLIADLRSEHAALLAKEGEARAEAEREVRRLKREVGAR